MTAVPERRPSRHGCPATRTRTARRARPAAAAARFALLLALAAGPGFAQSAAPAAAVQSERAAFQVVEVTGALEHPWALAFLPDGRILVTERAGRLRVVARDGRLDPRPVDGLPKVAALGQGGLLDVVLHPRFADNGWIYLSMSTDDGSGAGTDVVRGRLVTREGANRLEDVQTLFRMSPRSGRGQHFGSRLALDAKGMLYITLGDRGEMQRAQRLDDHAGSVIRLHDDGRVPADNPFVMTPGARPEIFSWGNRNVQGAAIHPVSGELWTHEHGPQGGDEINVIRSGRNYGWPVITHGVNYGIGTRIGEGTARAGMEQPLLHWTPSIAPSGMAFYTGTDFPGWKGNLLVGALAGQALYRLELDGEKVVGQERLLYRQVGRVRDVRMGPDGLVYLLTDARNGQLLRLQPVGKR